MSLKDFDQETLNSFNCSLIEKQEPLFFNDPESFWIIESGYVDVFLVPVDQQNNILGKGLKCFRQYASDIIFGCTSYIIHENESLILMGISSHQAKVLQGSKEKFLSTNFDLTIVEKIDHWIQSIDQSMSSYFDIPERCELIEAEPDLTYQEGEFLSAHYKDIIWVEGKSSGLLYAGKKELKIEPQKLYPITHWSYLQLEPPVDKGSTKTQSINAYHTPTLLLRDDFRDLFKNYTTLFMQIMYHNAKQKVIQTERSQKLYRKSELYQKARFASLLDPSSRKSKQEPIQTEGLIHLCERIFRDHQLEPPPTSELRVLRNEDVKETLYRLGFGVRELDLKDWDPQKINSGHIIGTKENKKDLVGFFPPMGGKRKTYTYNDPLTHTERELKPEDIENSSFSGLMIYPPLPKHVDSLKGLIRYSLKGQKNQLRKILFVVFLNAMLFMVTPILTSRILVTFLPNKNWGLFSLALVSLFTMSLISILAYWINARMFLSISSHFLTYSTSFLWKRALNFPLSFFQKNSVGKVLVCLYSPVFLGNLISTNLIQGGSALISGVISLSLLLYYAPNFAGILILSLMALFTINLFILRKFANFQKKINDLQFKMTNYSLQMFNAIGKIRSAQRENFALSRWAEIFSKKILIKNQSDKMRALYTALNEHFLFYANILFFVFIIWRLSNETNQPMEDFLVITAVLTQLAVAIVQAGNVSILTLQAIPSIERVNFILKEKTEEKKGQIHPPTLRGGIEFSHVFFNYLDARGKPKPILKDISFSVNPGEYVALVGVSGSGKSTLIKLLLGLEQPSSGAIYLDNYDLSNLDLEDLRRQMGAVLQSNEIIQGSVIKNILLGLEKDDQDVNFKLAWDAATKASLHEDIDDLPMKMNTWIGQGDSLSGGQRQRLLIARAMAKQPRILLFDEATSALDNITQSNIKGMLDSINITRVVIAHRLSTITNVNRVIVLKDGCIAEQGSYQGLLKARGEFYKLAKNQLL